MARILPTLNIRSALVAVGIVSRWMVMAFIAALSLANAATSEGALRMEMITGYNLTVDSNIESPSGKSPSAVHVGVKILNDGPIALTNVEVRIGNLTDAATGTGTAGTFASRTVTVSGANGYSGTFALQMPGGGADAVRTIPRIEAGGSVTQYFFLTYPLKDGSGKSVTGASADLSDDLWLNYDVWAQASESETVRRVDKRNTVTMRKQLSSMSNKVWPTTTSKVPDKYLSLSEASLGWRPGTGAPRIPGASVTEGIWYDLGRIGEGFDNNQDGIPDRNVWLQPAGDPTQFNPLAARMVKCYGIIIISLNQGGERVIPFEDRLYFDNLPADSTGAVGLIYYEFLPLNASLPGRLTPYQQVASGYNDEKFSSDFGSVTNNAAPAAPTAAISKTGPATRGIGQNADYIITVTNTGTVQFGWPDLGLPVVIEDPIPPGLHYVAGSAVAGPNGTTPAGGVFTPSYSTDGGATWTATQPTLASTVNRLRWTLDRALAPGDTATVRLSATVPAGFPSINFTNTGILKTGSETEVARSSWITTLVGNNSIGDFIWRDLNRNGLQDDGAGSGIPNISVSLYVDSNSNGVLDSGEPLYGTTSTDSSGIYTFSALPDRRYIVRVDALDPDVPSGFNLKQGVSADIALDLDSGSVNTNPVIGTTADWPFIDVLEVVKTVTPTTYNEGALITYTVHLENHMGTVPAVQPPTQTQWITSATQNAQASGVALVSNTVGSPNNVYGYIDWNSNSDNITTNGVGTFASTTGTITQVELLVSGYMSRPLVDDAIGINITTDGSSPATSNPTYSISTATLNATVGTPQRIAIPLAGAWTWAQAQAIRARLIAVKSTVSDRGDFYIDSIGVRVTASTTSAGTAGPNTINPLPLTDTFDPAKIQFVDASVQPDSTTPAGTLSWVNLGPLNPGARRTITATFRALSPSDTNADGRRDSMAATNKATSNNAYFVSGLSAGGGSSSIDVTINPRGTIGDFVYWDVNALNGFDAGDVPLSGVIVQLWQRSGTSYVFTGSTAITNSSGFYTFTGLGDVAAANAYQVRIVTDIANDLFTLPFSTFSTTQFPAGGSTSSQTGYVVGPDIILNNNSDTLTNNDSNLLQDFGFDSNTASMISGKLFRDWNGNGVQDAGEEALAGYTINLSGAATATTTTDADGFYQFLNVTTTGNHTVTVTSPPAGHTQTLDPDATLNSNTVVNVLAGNAYLNRNFAYRPSGVLTLGDTVFYDWNGNGTQNVGEGGIAGIEVWLYEDANVDGVINAEDARIAITTTNVSGFYQFTGLASGNYIVHVHTTSVGFPTSFKATQDYDGLADSNAKVSLSASLATVDFGYQPTGTASIGNSVWLDANNNGLLDSGESGINGVSVQLFRSGQTPGTDTPVATATTSGGGLYAFGNLPDGGYYVYIPSSNFSIGNSLAFLPWSSTTTNAGSNLIDSDDNGIQSALAAAVTSPLITLTVGQSNNTVDFGFTGTGSAGDFVFYDNNGNGGQDYGETGIPGVSVRIFLDANQDGQADSPAPWATAITSDGTGGIPTGFYQFTILAPSTYFIQVDTATLPTGLTYTADPDRSGIPVGMAPVSPPGDHADSYVPILMGASYTGADFGYRPPGAIGDFVWLDLDQDGIADAGEPGLANVEVRITNGVTTYNVLTDVGGYWSATVADGNWTVSVPVTNFANGAPLSGMLTTFDADGAGTANSTVIAITGGVVTTPSGLIQGNLGIDFGYRPNGMFGISGTVLINDSRISGTADDIDDFYDDGVDMDAGPFDETELEGIVVYLYTQSGLFLGSDVTGVNGSYSFPSLPAGTYRVIIGTTSAPLDEATLTTTVANNPAVSLVDASSGTSVIQTVTISSAAVADVDFAFDSNTEYDFGDLPLSYGMTTLSQGGARHMIPGGGPTSWLGSAPDADNNGISNAQAAGDDLNGSDDEDGVIPVSITSWTNGNNGGAMQVTVQGVGWLVGWVDWNNDRDFLDSGEFVVNQQVSTGTIPISINIPAGTITGTSHSWLSRFRLLPVEPDFPQYSYTGDVLGGEVEDHLLQKNSGGSIGDFVWMDSNGDGVFDIAESGLAGCSVQLRNGSDQLIASQMTSNGNQDVDGDGLIDPVGYYRFRGLAAATYRVVVTTTPVGYAASYDEDGGVMTPNGSSTVVLASSVQHVTADFGYEPLRSSISGQVRYDLDGDGNLLDADSGAAFVRIQLWTDPNADGDPSDGVQIAEAFTDTNGDYVFSNVATGSYVIIEVNPPGSTSTADVDGGDFDRIAVSIAGVHVTGRDFLDTLPPLYSISGTAYEDNNATSDSVVSSDDYRVAGVWIRLFLDRNGDGLVNDGDPEVGAVQTNATGAYLFAGLQPGNYAVSQEDPAGSNSIWDAGGLLTDNLIGVALTNANVVSRDFLDNNALGGISGTVRADTNGDGTAEINIAGVVLSLLDASGNQVLDAQNNPRTSVTNAGGFYSFSDLAAANYRISEAQPTGYGSLSDKDSGDLNLIGDQQLIGVTNGAVSADNDFLEYLQACPDYWNDWKAKWAGILGGETDPADNPDGDRYNNLIEYAFCLPPNSGARKPFCLAPSISAPSGMDGVFRRTAIGGGKDLTYTLQWASGLGSPTAWIGSVVLNSGNTTVANNGDGTETVRIPDLETLTALAAGSGFVRIQVSLNNGIEQANATTEVLGWVETTFGNFCATYNNPFLACASFTGTIDGVSGQQLDMTTSAGTVDLATVLAPGMAYYLEVESGDLAGHRFDVASASGTSITLANDANLHSHAPPHNTLVGALPAALAGDRVAIHSHYTLNSLFPQTSFTAGGDSGTADQVQLFAGGAWKIYWLYNANDGDPQTARWVDSADAGMADAGATVVAPGHGMFYNNRSASVPVLAYGEVRANDFVRPLSTAQSLVGGGFPMHQPPSGNGGRAMTLNAGLFGSRDFKTADSFFVWNADATPSVLGYSTYYLANAGAANPSFVHWLKVGDSSATFRENEFLLKRDRAVFMRSKNGLNTYRTPLPWTP